MSSSPSSSTMPSYGPPPPLVPDVSSSKSDESDGVASPPTEYNGAVPDVSMPPYQYGPFTMPTQEQSGKALAFLPHPPSSSPMSNNSGSIKKSDKERKRTTSSNPVTPNYASTTVISGTAGSASVKNGPRQRNWRKLGRETTCWMSVAFLGSSECSYYFLIHSSSISHAESRS